MPQKLIIRLTNATETTTSLSWLLLDENNKNTFESRQNNDAELLIAARQAEHIIVLVPGEDILLTQVKLPKLSWSQLIKAIPLALEDQLTEDPTLLHFAVGNALKGEPLPVLVANKEKINTWLSTLKTRLRETYTKVTLLLPDMLAIPFESGNISVLVENKGALVRINSQTGFATETDNLFSELQLILKHSTLSPAITLQLYGATSSILTPEQMTQLGIRIQTEPTPANTLEMMSITLQEPYPINLLQGNYLPRHKKISIQHLTNACIMIAGAWLILSTLTNLTSYFILARENAQLKTAIQTMYAAAYPKSPIPDNPKTSMQKDLATMRANHADSTFLRLLLVTGKNMAPLITTGLELKSLSYQNNELVIDVEAKNITPIESLHHQLEVQGLKVAISDEQRTTNGLIKTRLTIEEVN